MTVLGRASSVNLDAVEVTGEGFQLYDALFARTGLQNYDDGHGGQIIEYRPFSEVDASIPSYELRPLTDLHPPRNVTTDSARVLARGAMSGAHWHESDARTREVAHLGGRLAVWDRALQVKFDAATARGVPMQLSMGYELDLDETPGTTPWGAKYDAVQRGMRINHGAAVPLGRAGSAQVVLDAAGGWCMDGARTLAEIAPHRDSKIYVDFGRWSRHDAADLRTQRSTMRNTDATKFGSLVRRLAKEKEVTAEALGRAAGISASTVQQIMSGEIEIPPARRITGLARALGVPKSTLEAALPASAKKDTMKTIKIQFDGGDLELEVAADATPDEIAQAAADAIPPEFLAQQKKKKEEGKEADKKKTDAFELRFDELTRRTDALATAKAIIGLDYAGATAHQIHLDTIEVVMGKDARAEIDAIDKADRHGAAAYAFRQAVKTYGARDAGGGHQKAARLLKVVNDSRAAGGDKGDGKGAPKRDAFQEATKKRADEAEHGRASSGS